MSAMSQLRGLSLLVINDLVTPLPLQVSAISHVIDNLAFNSGIFRNVGRVHTMDSRLTIGVTWPAACPSFVGAMKVGLKYIGMLRPFGSAAV